MIRKIYTLIITMLVLILSMSVSVFAWFTYKHYDTDANNLIADTETIVPVPEGDRELIEIFEGDALNYLTYLTKDDFEEGASYLLGFANIVKITLENSNDVDVNVNLRLNSILAPEYGFLSGSIDSLKYIVMDETEDFHDVYNEITNNNSKTFYNNVRSYNNQKSFELGAGSIETPSTKDIYILVWGDFQNLTVDQKIYMQSVAYRLLLNLRLV